MQASDSSAQTAQGGSDNHRHFFSNWYANTGSGNTGGPNQSIAPYMRQLWLRQKLANGTIDAFSAGGTFTTVQSDATDLYTENYTPQAGEGFVACGATFDYIAII